MTARALRSLEGAVAPVPPSPPTNLPPSQASEPPAPPPPPGFPPGVEGSSASLEEAEDQIWAGIKSPLKVGYALLALYEQQLYLQNTTTFAAYVKDHLPFSKSRAFRLIRAARMHRALEPAQGLMPDNEAQLRELTKYPVETAQRLWQGAVELSDGKHVPSSLIVQAAFELDDVDSPSRRPSQKAAAISELQQALYLLQLTMERRIEESPRQEYIPIFKKIGEALQRLAPMHPLLDHPIESNQTARPENG